MRWYKTQELISHVYEELEKGRKEHTPFFFLTCASSKLELMGRCIFSLCDSDGPAD